MRAAGAAGGARSPAPPHAAAAAGLVRAAAPAAAVATPVAAAAPGTAPAPGRGTFFEPKKSKAPLLANPGAAPFQLPLPKSLDMAERPVAPAPPYDAPSPTEAARPKASGAPVLAMNEEV